MSGRSYLSNRAFTRVFPVVIGTLLLASSLLLHVGTDAATLVPSGTHSSNEHFTKAGSPYIINGTVRFRGSTLVIDPGVVVKFKTATSTLSIHGDATFTSLATKDEPIYFTSYKDDAHGGDTNGDGNATAPAPGDWSNLNIGGGSFFGSDKLDFIRVYYGGAASPAAPLTPVYGLQVTYSKYDGLPILNYTLANIEVAHNQNGILLVNTGHNLTFASSSIHNNVSNGAAVSFGGAFFSNNYLRNNWWGDPSGPRTSSNPSGAGDYVPGNWPTTPWLTVDPLPPPITGPQPCTQDCFSNVLFLPGIESSRLYRPDYDGGTDKLWEPLNNGDVRDLYLNPDGSSQRFDIYTKDGDVLDELPGGGNIYQSFLDDLETWKSIDHIITDYRVIPYDWRLSLDDILDYGNRLSDGRIYYSGDQRAATDTPYILRELRALAASAKNGKVVIVAHSNGGLVAKELLKRLEATNDPLLQKIESLVLVAVPQTGTPMAVGAALHGFDQALPFSWAPLLLNTQTARAFASTSPMAYHLLPSSAYFAGVGGSVPTPPITFVPGSLTDQFINAYGDGINTYSELHNFLLGSEGRAQATFDDVLHPSILSPSLLSYAENKHATLDTWTPHASTTVYEIAGWGNETLASLKYYTGTTCIRAASRGNGLCEEYAPQLQYSPREVVDGDGTVITSSALAMSTLNQGGLKVWLDLKAYNRVLNVSLPGPLRTGHADIFEVESVRKFILNNILRAADDVLPSYVSALQPQAGPSDSRLHFTLHSPLALSARDNQGREISATTSTIPDAIYRRFGEVQYISVPADAHPTLILEGEADGSFTLDVEESLGGVTTVTTTFAGIPNTAESHVTMDFTDGTLAEASPLVIDYDGDGDTELALSPKVGEKVMVPNPLTVTANNQTVTLGSDTPTLTATLSGFEGGDTEESSVTGSASCITTVTSDSGVGNYPITCTVGTLTSEDYIFTDFVAGTLTITYRWEGFHQPIDDTTINTSLTSSVFKGGSTVPVKFQLKNSSGTLVQSAAAPIWLAPVKLLSPLSAAVDEPVYTISGTSGSNYEWDSISKQYSYNWSTKGLTAGYWYRVYAQLEDGKTYSVVVGLR